MVDEPSGTGADRLRATYVLTCAAGDDPETKARDIALEQTVELPEPCVPRDVAARVVGAVERVEPAGDGRWRAVIAYDAAALVDDVPQLLNLLFGNISLKTGILLAAIGWPASLLARLPGPQLGVDGLRELCGAHERRPLLCAAVKPVGLSVERLAERCRQLALGGIDLVKDDHGLTDQPSAPFRERVERCVAAVARANAETGGRSVYLPNVTAGALHERVEVARAAGCGAVLVSPLLVGCDAVRRLATASGLGVLAHPALAGAFFHPDHGIAPEVLLGDIYRAIGSDGVIYPNVGGRFPFGEGTCLAINASLRRPLGRLKPAFPVPGGGIHAADVPRWVERYGNDTIFLIGRSLYDQPDLVAAARGLADAVRRRS